MVFAAPLVVIAACGAPGQAAPPPLAPPPAALDAGTGGATDAAPDAEAPEAAVDDDGAPRDDSPGTITIVTPTAAPDVEPELAPFVVTGPGTARPGRVLVHIRERSVQPAGYASCHDFGPGSRGCNPPRPVRVPAITVDLPLLELERTDEATVLGLPIGGSSGVRASWPVAVLAPARKPSAAAKVSSVRERETLLATNLSPSELRGGVELELGGRPGAPWVPLPPPSLFADELDIQPYGTGSIVTVGAGSHDGLGRDWSIVLVDAAGTPVRGGSGRVLKVTVNASVIKVRATPRQLRRATGARLEPPPPRR